MGKREKLWEQVPRGERTKGKLVTFEERTRRRLDQECPACENRKLIVYQQNACVSHDHIAAYVLDVTEEPPQAEEERVIDALIYCPECGALCEAGGLTHYPRNVFPKAVDDEPTND